MPNKLISFIVPMFNHLEQSKAMLDSLIKTIPSDTPYELILINDASTDDTRAWLDSIQNKNINVLHNEINLGYAKTNNIAVRHSSGEYIFLLNNDLVFKADWLLPMLDILDTKPLNAGVVGNIQYRVLGGEIDHAGIVLNKNGQFQHSVYIDQLKPYAKQLAVTGACLLISKDDFIKLDGFDENFVNGGEDIDLCFRLKKSLGKSAYISYKSSIDHHVSLSRDRTSLQNEKNSRFLFEKWREVIKTELSRIWANLISSNAAEEIEAIFDGKLSKNSPQLLSQIAVENLISREEHRWKRLLDDQNCGDLLKGNYSTKGLTYSEKLNCYLLHSPVEFKIKDIASAVNFYVCGNKINQNSKENIAITIEVNGLQEKTIYLGEEANINVGIVNPIILSHGINIFKVHVNFYNPIGKTILSDASKSIVLKHLVFDDIKLISL